MWVSFKEIIGAEKMDQVDKSAYLHKNDSLSQLSRTHKKKCLSTYNSRVGEGAEQEVPCNLVAARLDPRSLRDPVSRVDRRSQTKENNHLLRVGIIVLTKLYFFGIYFKAMCRAKN